MGQLTANEDASLGKAPGITPRTDPAASGTSAKPAKARKTRLPLGATVNAFGDTVTYPPLVVLDNAHGDKPTVLPEALGKDVSRYGGRFFLPQERPYSRANPPPPGAFELVNAEIRRTDLYSKEVVIGGKVLAIHRGGLHWDCRYFAMMDETGGMAEQEFGFGWFEDFAKASAMFKRLFLLYMRVAEMTNPQVEDGVEIVRFTARQAAILLGHPKFQAFNYPGSKSSPRVIVREFNLPYDEWMLQVNLSLLKSEQEAKKKA